MQNLAAPKDKTRDYLIYDQPITSFAHYQTAIFSQGQFMDIRLSKISEYTYCILIVIPKLE